MTSSFRVFVACVSAWLLWGCASAPRKPAAGGPSRHAQSAQAHFASPFTYEWFVRAELLRASGRLEDAIEAYRTALTGADEDAQLSARLGSALAEHGDLAGAQQVLDEALVLDPESESVWLARAELSELRGDLDSAINALERAERAAPSSARAPLRLAELLREHGHVERASAVLERFRARSSVAGGADAHRAALEQALERRDADEVFEATLPYRLGAPPSATLVQRAATLLLERERPVLALRVLELLPPPERDASLELRVLRTVGSLPALESWFVTHEPTRSDERVEAARALLLLGKVEDAAIIVDAERLSQPVTPILQLLAAQVELARGHYADAAESFARVPSAASVAAEARLGLTQALSALGLGPLGAEVGLHASQAAAAAAASVQ